MKFSVVIPTKDRLTDLQKCIQSLISQTMRPKEIIIIDGSSTKIIEEYFKILQSYSGILFKYVKQKEGKFGRAKNLGVAETEGDVILFVDDDVVLDNRHIEELNEVYDRDTDHLVGAVQGFCTNIEYYNRLKTTYCRFFMLGGCFGDKSRLLPSGTIVVPAKLLETKKANGFVGPAHSYRKSVFSEFHFDEVYEYGDELNFSVRVSSKYKLYITPFAKFVHNLSPVGRNAETYQLKNTYTRYYVFKNIMPQTNRNKLYFLWSHIGYLIGYLGMSLIKPTKQNCDYAKGSIKGTNLIIRSMRAGK